MISLTAHQVARVRIHLARAGLNENLSAELLDHLCCAVEARLAAGDDFEPALAATLRIWPLHHLQELQQTVHFTTRTRPMLYRISAAAALLAGIAFLSPFPLPEKDAAETPFHAQEFSTHPVRTDPPTASPIAGIILNAANISSGFGNRKHPLTKQVKRHRGIDIKADSGTPVLATADGKVVYAGTDGGNGITVRLRHTDGYVTAYKHLSKYIVERGDRVLLGQEIAAVGSTGLSTAPHLHYEVLKDDVPVDPLALR